LNEEARNGGSGGTEIEGRKVGDAESPGLYLLSGPEVPVGDKRLMPSAYATSSLQSAIAVGKLGAGVVLYLHARNRDSAI
jgi:hypothetical protein